MITKERPVGIRKTARLPVASGAGSVVSDRAVRAIQIALALYLLPVLLVVLALGGLAMLVLGVGRFFAGPVRGSLG